MGERLIAFRDSSNRIGLIDEFCAHRRVSLWFGRNEECGLRCAYHGWKYDVTGQCVDLPSEPEETGMRSRIRLKAYPCVEHGGAIWTYMGPPELKPALPALEWTLVPPERRFISKRLQECNYLQAMEGGIDSSHVSFLHGAALHTDPMFRGAKGNVYNERDRMPHFEVVEFDGGLFIGARRNADDDRYYWRITPWIAPFYTLIPPRAGHPIGGHAWIPIDDEHCWSWSINYHPDRAIAPEQLAAMKGGHGIHVRYVPGTFVPLANKSNDYLMDRAAQAAGMTYQRRRRHRHAGRVAAGEHGAGHRPLARESVHDRQRHHLRAALAPAHGQGQSRRQAAFPRSNPMRSACARARSSSTSACKFKDGARHGLFPALDTAPVSV